MLDTQTSDVCVDNYNSVRRVVKRSDGPGAHLASVPEYVILPDTGVAGTV